MSLEVFKLYLVLGKEHILDYANGYDHILFVAALCVAYPVSEWKKVLILVTSFTIGHSITLVLATFQIIAFESQKVEFFIPVTIFIAACLHIFRRNEEHSTSFFQINYLLALFFGLVHGMGFSNYLRIILGKEQSVAMPLLAFNIGLEFGQMVVVLIAMVIGYVLVNIVGVSRRSWRLVISSGIAGAALVLAKENVFW